MPYRLSIRAYRFRRNDFFQQTVHFSVQWGFSADFIDFAESLYKISQKKNRHSRRFSIDIILLINPKVFQNTVYNPLRHGFLEILVVDLLILRGVANVA